MSENRLNSTTTEDGSAQDTAGAPHNSLTQSEVGSSEKRTPWDKFLARLRSVWLVKSAKKLRDLRDEARAWYPAIESEQQAIQVRLDTESDPLDKAALKEELVIATAKIGKLDSGVEAINKRALALVGGSEV